MFVVHRHVSNCSANLFASHFGTVGKLIFLLLVVMLRTVWMRPADAQMHPPVESGVDDPDGDAGVEIVPVMLGGVKREEGTSAASQIGTGLDEAQRVQAQIKRRRLLVAQGSQQAGFQPRVSDGDDDSSSTVACRQWWAVTRSGSGSRRRTHPRHFTVCPATIATLCPYPVWGREQDRMQITSLTHMKRIRL